LPFPFEIVLSFVDFPTFIRRILLSFDPSISNDSSSCGGYSGSLVSARPFSSCDEHPVGVAAVAAAVAAATVAVAVAVAAAAAAAAARLPRSPLHILWR